MDLELDLAPDFFGRMWADRFCQEQLRALDCDFPYREHFQVFE